MTAGVKVPETWMVACFIKGINAAAAKDMHMAKVQTMLEGVQLLELLYGEGNKPVITRAFATSEVDDEASEGEETPSGNGRVVCRVVQSSKKRMDHGDNGGRVVKRYRTDQQTCWNCQTMGHVANDCTKDKVPGAIEKGIQELRKQKAAKLLSYNMTKKE